MTHYDSLKKHLAEIETSLEERYGSIYPAG